MSNDPHEQEALDALVNTYSNAGDARTLVELAGFPLGQIPAFSTALVFWHRVASDARNGMLAGGLRPILEQAARQYPHNPAFAPYAPPAASSSPAPAAAATKPVGTGPIRIFISYSHKGEDPSYLEELHIRLTAVGHKIPIKAWDDRELLAGSNLKQEIMEQLRIADVVILLISPNFIASDYCFSVELAGALKKLEQGEGLVVPIIIRPEPTWSDHQIGEYLALPKDGKAISKWPDPDDAWEDVTRGLKRLLTNLARKRGLLPS